MDSILETGYSWILDSISYQDESLCITLEELFKSPTPLNKSDGAQFDGVYAISPSQSSRKVTIRFNNLITWQVINESCETASIDPEAIYEPPGFISEIKQSLYLSYVQQRHGWCAITKGEFKIYRIWSENEIIEITATEPPEISYV